MVGISEHFLYLGGGGTITKNVKADIPVCL